MRDLWTCALRELLRRKGRTFATLLGYVLAVALMVLLVSLLLTAREASSGILRGTGTHFTAFAPACDPICEEVALDKREGFVANGVPVRLISAGLVDKLKRVASVRHAAPYLLFRFRDPSSGQLFTVGGFDPRDQESVGTTCCAPADLRGGRFLTEQDRGVVLLEEAFARSRSLRAGDSLRIAGRDFPVVGVVNPGVRPAKADVYMTLADARQSIGSRMTRPLKDEVSAILVEVRSSARQREAMEAARQILPDAVVSSYACWKPAAMVMGMAERTAWVLILAVGIGATLFALKSQLASVVERRHDIGILKAIGWTDGTIVAQILVESALQGGVGGAAGAVLATLCLARIPTRSFTGASAAGHLAAPPQIVVAGVLLALLGGLLAGVVPALLAARQHPADALRRL